MSQVVAGFSMSLDGFVAALGFQIIGTVPESFDHPEHGLVGLHVMYRPL
jgi:hypothetical protein